MADFGAVQPRQFILDSSRQNGATLGEFHQNNNRYFCTLELFDHSVPVTIPDGAEISIKCKKINTANPNAEKVYVLDKNSPDFASKVKVVSSGENKITVDRWAAMVAQDGQMLLGVDVDGMSTYTVTYTVDKDLMNGTQVIHHETPITDFAKVDLSNVSSESMKAAGKAAGFMQNDMADVDLDKLSEKINDTDVGKQLKDIEKAITQLGTDQADNKKAIDNVVLTENDPKVFDRDLKANPAFIALQNRHPSTAGLTPSEIKALFYASRRETTTPVNFNAGDLASATTVLFVPQFTQTDQIFTQQLPPVSSNKLIMVEILRSTGITGGKLVLNPFSGDFINGASSSLEITDDGYCGVLIPIPQENGWQWLHYSSTTTALTQFEDPITKEDFPASKVVSIDKSINIRKLSNGIADISTAPDVRNSGIMATLGWKQLRNSKFPNSRVYFGDVKIGGNAYVYPDLDKKSFVLTDFSKDGSGTTYFVGLYLPIIPGETDAITQDGEIRLELADDSNTVIQDRNGNPAGVTVLYKTGQTETEELYCGEILVKGQKTVHAWIDERFADQEIISLSPATAICFQAVTLQQGIGTAFLAFCEHTGYKIQINKRYIGTNYMNLAQFLDFAEPETEFSPGISQLGDETYIEVVGNPIKATISSNRITLKDNGTDLPVFSLYKRIKNIDAQSIIGATLNLSTKITNKQNAVTMSLLKFDGTGAVPTPGVQSYQNTIPTFNAGWSIVDSLDINEDISTEDRILQKIFTVPDARELAVVMYPRDSQIPTEITLGDMEVDVVPSITRFEVSVKDAPREQSLKYSDTWVKGTVMCPSGDSAYRYTCNETKTRIPIGVISGSGIVKNDHSWTDVGSSDPNRTQGNAEFSDDADVSFSYASIKAGNDTATENTIDVWLELNDVEVPNSRYTGKIGAKSIPTVISLPDVSFKIKSGDKLAAFMQSNKKDGFYLIAYPDGVPLFRWEMKLREISAKK